MMLASFEQALKETKVFPGFSLGPLCILDLGELERSEAVGILFEMK